MQKTTMVKLLLILLTLAIFVPPCIDTMDPGTHVFFVPLWRLGTLATFDILPHFGWWFFEIVAVMILIKMASPTGLLRKNR